MVSCELNFLLIRKGQTQQKPSKASNKGKIKTSQMSSQRIYGRLHQGWIESTGATAGLARVATSSSDLCVGKVWGVSVMIKPRLWRRLQSLVQDVASLQNSCSSEKLQSRPSLENSFWEALALEASCSLSCAVPCFRHTPLRWFQMNSWGLLHSRQYTMFFSMLFGLQIQRERQTLHITL